MVVEVYVKAMILTRVFLNVCASCIGQYEKTISVVCEVSETLGIQKF